MASTHEKQHEVPRNLGDEGDLNYLLRDRISQLPDAILIDIIDKIAPLSIKEAARTSVLSKRWRYLWTNVTCLNFDDVAHPMDTHPRVIDPLERRKRVLQRRRGLILNEYKVGSSSHDCSSRLRDNFKTVSEVLQLHQGSTVDGLRINGGYYNPDDVDNWIEFAIRKRVQRLEINGIKGGKTSTGKSFECLIGISCMKSLRHLSLKSINISGEIVGQVLSHCQLLEHLSICGSENLYALKAVGSSLRLKFLQISSCTRLVRVDISAPDLVSFIYEGNGVYRRGIVLKHAPKLVEVSLSLEGVSGYTNDFLSISACFSHLHTLNLCMYLRRETVRLPQFPELSSLKDLSLTIHTRNYGQSLLDFTALLERSPFLHTLTLQFKWLSFRKNYTRNMQEIERCPHQRLSVVKCSGFIGIGGSIVDTEFSMYLIENAVVLEKLIIDLEKKELAQRPYILPEFETTEKKLDATREHALQLGTQLRPGAEYLEKPDRGGAKEEEDDDFYDDDNDVAVYDEARYNKLIQFLKAERNKENVLVFNNGNDETNDYTIIL